MKRVLIAVMLISTFAFAEYSKEDRIADMTAMADGMAEIQKGFLYNSKEMIDSGVQKVRNHAMTIQPPRIGEALSQDQRYAMMFARKQQRKIDEHAARLAQKFADNDKYGAMNHFTKVLKQCTACHVKLRKW